MRKRKIDFSSQKGVALFLTIILSLLGLILLAGLYYAYQRVTGILFPIKSYATVREAAVGTVELIASYVDREYFKSMERRECPKPLSLSNDTLNCCRGEIRFRLAGENLIFSSYATICLIGVAQAGFSMSPVVELDPSVKITQPYIYAITVKAIGPRGTTSMIESIYQSR